jgi:hypothetical protein
MRRALVLAALLVLAAAAPARANDVTPSCTVGGASVDCSSWHSGSVTLHWTWDPFGSETATSNCDTRTFGSDTAGTDVQCSVQWGPESASYKVTIRVDKTPPRVTGATPDRPPDYNGWYNHPVAFAFHGSDALSGLASCETVTYAGPDGATAAVTGGCRDVAGNRGVGSFPLAFDDTPPAPAQVQVEPENRSIVLRWTAPPDATRVLVVRDSTRSARAAKTIYRGSGDDVKDRGLHNGVRYRYRVTVVDQAGNATTTRTSAMPTSSTLRPVSGTEVSAAPRLTWKPLRGASYYNVQLFRGRTKVLSAWPHGAHLQLPAAWRYRGHHRHLKAGIYRWFVWPGYGARNAQRYGSLVGRSSFRVVAH